MDFNALQHKLFEMDPSDPAEDLRKLKEQAGGSAQKSAATDVNYMQESVEVPEGSLEMDRDYSIADFAALAGVTLTEQQKKGSAGQLKAKQAFKKSSKPGPGPETPHPARGKLVGENDGFTGGFKQGVGAYNSLDAFDAPGTGGSKKVAAKKPGDANDNKIQGSATAQQIAKALDISNPQLFIQAVNKLKQGQQLQSRQQHMILSEAFQKLLAMDPQRTQKVFTMLKRMEVAQEAQQPKLKPRDPNAQTMNDLRKSGAMGVHKDKKNVLPRKEKHKTKQYESIKDMLYAKLNEKK